MQSAKSPACPPAHTTSGFTGQIAILLEARAVPGAANSDMTAQLGLATIQNGLLVSVQRTSNKVFLRRIGS